MWLDWFQVNYWVAAWLTEFQTLGLELFIGWMIWRFLGGMTREQARNLRGKLQSLGTPTESDRVRESLENE